MKSSYLIGLVGVALVGCSQASATGEDTSQEGNLVEIKTVETPIAKGSCPLWKDNGGNGLCTGPGAYRLGATISDDYVPLLVVVNGNKATDLGLFQIAPVDGTRVTNVEWRGTNDANGVLQPHGIVFRYAGADLDTHKTRTFFVAAKVGADVSCVVKAFEATTPNAEAAARQAADDSRVSTCATGGDAALLHAYKAPPSTVPGWAAITFTDKPLGRGFRFSGEQHGEDWNDRSIFDGFYVAHDGMLELFATDPSNIPDEKVPEAIGRYTYKVGAKGITLSQAVVADTTTPYADEEFSVAP